MKAKANFTYYFIFCIFFVSYDYAMIIPTTQGNLQKITPSGHGPQSIKSFFDDKKNTISIIIFPSKTINDDQAADLHNVIYKYIETDYQKGNGLFNLQDDCSIDQYTKQMVLYINETLKNQKLKDKYGNNLWYRAGALATIIMSPNNDHVEQDIKIVCIGDLDITCHKEGNIFFTKKPEGHRKIVYRALGFFCLENNLSGNRVLQDPFVVSVNKGKIDWVCIQKSRGLSNADVSFLIAKYPNHNHQAKIIALQGMRDNFRQRISLVYLFPLMRRYLFLQYPTLSGASGDHNKDMFERQYEKCRNCFNAIHLPSDHEIMKMLNTLKDYPQVGYNPIILILQFGKEKKYFDQEISINNTSVAYLNPEQKIENECPSIRLCMNKVNPVYNWYRVILQLCACAVMRRNRSAPKKFMSTLQQISTIYKIEHERAIGELSQKTNIISVFLHFFDLNQKINTYLSELSENIGDCPSLDKSIQALKGWTTYYGCALIK